MVTVTQLPQRRSPANVLWPRWLNLSLKITRAPVTMAANYKSACLIRSWAHVFILLSRMWPFICLGPTLLFSLLWCPHSSTAPWTLGGNGNSFTSTSHRTDSTGESSFFIFYETLILPSPPTFLPPQEKKKYTFFREGGRNPLFVFCTTEQAILMAENEALLPRRMVMRMEFSTFSCRSDAVSQRLISAIAIWQTACQHSLALQHLLIVCGDVK